MQSMHLLLVYLCFHKSHPPLVLTMFEEQRVLLEFFLSSKSWECRNLVTQKLERNQAPQISTPSDLRKNKGSHHLRNILQGGMGLQFLSKPRALSIQVKGPNHALMAVCSLPSAQMKGKCYHVQFTQCWGVNSGLHGCWASSLPTKLQPQVESKFLKYNLYTVF